jgi:hypothetical protein
MFDRFRTIRRRDMARRVPRQSRAEIRRHAAQRRLYDRGRFRPEKHGARIDRLRFKALTGPVPRRREQVMLMKPQTFMNLSGDAAIQAVNFYKLKPEHVIVVSDEISLPMGKLRVRPSGSAGGHNGLKSIIPNLGTDEFPRIRWAWALRPGRITTWPTGCSPVFTGRTPPTWRTPQSAPPTPWSAIFSNGPGQGHEHLQLTFFDGGCSRRQF